MGQIAIEYGGIPVSKANPLPVDPGLLNPLPIVGNVGGVSTEICVKPTVATSAYSAGFEVGQLLQFDGAVRQGIWTGIIESVRMTCLSVQTAEFDVTFFSAKPNASAWTDHGTPSIAAGDIPLVIGTVKLTSNFSGLGTHTVYNSDAIGRVIKLATTALYAVITTPGTPTFTTAGDVQLCVSLLQD